MIFVMLIRIGKRRTIVEYSEFMNNVVSVSGRNCAVGDAPSLGKADESRVVQLALSILKAPTYFSPCYVWAQSKRWWHGTYPFDAELTQIEKAILRKEHWESFGQSLIEVHKALAKGRQERKFTKSRLRLKLLLNSLEESVLDRFLQEMVKDKFRCGEDLLLDSCFELLSFDKLKSLINYKQPDVEKLCDDLQDVLKMADELATHYPKNDSYFTGRVSDRLGEHSWAIIRFFVNFTRSFIQTFLKSYDFSEEDDPALLRWEAEYRLSNFYEIMGALFVAAGWMLTMVRQVSESLWVPCIAAGALIAGSYSGIKLYNRFFRSAIEDLGLKCPNLVREAKLGHIGLIVGRQQELNAIMECLGEVDQYSKPPLLIGDPGVGKTEIVKAFAKEIALGKYPHLNGKQLFLVTPSKLLEKGNGLFTYFSRLEQLVEQIRGRENEVILFLDEMATLVKEGQKGTNVNMLKVLLDSGKFYMIGATTTAEYRETIAKDAAFDSRFRLINVKPLDHDECKAALLNIINQKKYAGVPVDDAAIERVLELANTIKPDRAQIRKAINLTVEAMNAVKFYKGPEKEELEKDELELQRTKERYFHQDRIALTMPEGRDCMEHLNALQERVSFLEEAVQVRQAAMDRFHHLREENKEWKRRYFNLAHELHSRPRQASLEKAAKEFLFIGQWVLKGLNDVSAEQEQELQNQGVHVRVDRELIEQVFNEWKSQLLTTK